MTGDPVEEYLAALRAQLRTPRGRTDEIVAEAEDHLRESAAAREATGLSAMAAQRAAVAAFGPVKRVTRAHRPQPSDYAAATAAGAWPLFGAFLLAAALFGLIPVWVQLGGDGLFTVLVHPAHGPVGSVEARPDLLQLTATIGGCALAGLFPLAAAFALLVFAVWGAGDALRVAPPRALTVMGMYQLVSGLPATCTPHRAAARRSIESTPAPNCWTRPNEPRSMTRPVTGDMVGTTTCTGSRRSSSRASTDRLTQRPEVAGVRTSVVYEHIRNLYVRPASE
jgi:hypothetical protein